jgi:hypothetical protein
MRPALPWPAHQRWWWLRQPRIADAAIGPTLTARLYDTDFDAGDCAYNAVAVAGDAGVWFAIGTHRADAAARLFRADPVTGRVTTVAALDEPATPGGPAIAHAKVHVPLSEWRGELIFATHVGYYRRERGIERPASHGVLRPYPGGRVLACGLESRRLRELGRAPHGEGILALALDRRRSRAFAATWPGGRLLELDLDSGRLDDRGPVFGRGEHGAPGRDWEPVGRDLAVDPRDGRVCWSRATGEIGWLDPAGRRGMLTSRLHGGGRPSAWRRLRWHEGRQAFAGVTAIGSRLFLFDPAADRIEYVASLDAARARRAFHRAPLSTLAFEVDAGRDEVRYLAHGPGLATRRMRHTVEVVTASLADGAVRRHGVLRLDDGRYPTFAQGLACAGGVWYALAWIELPEADETPRVRRLRALRGPHAAREIHGQPEEVGLIAFAAPRGSMA